MIIWYKNSFLASVLSIFGCAMAIFALTPEMKEYEFYYRIILIAVGVALVLLGKVVSNKKAERKAKKAAEQARSAASATPAAPVTRTTPAAPAASAGKTFTVASAPRFCSACGGSVQLLNGSYICAKCGSRFVVRGQSAPAAAPASAPAPAAAPAMSINDYYNAAYSYDNQEKYQDEIRVLSSGVSAYPNDVTMRIKLGRAYRRSGNEAMALQCYDQARAMNPKEPTVYTNIGTIHFFHGRYAEARPYYEQAIDLQEADPNATTPGDRASTYANYAYCMGKLGDLFSARRYLARARKEGYAEDKIKTICSDLKLDPSQIG